MNELAKKLSKKTPLYYLLRNWLVWRAQIKEFKEWESRGGLAPLPHILKQRTLRTYAIKYKLRVFVETGTYYGDMVEAMKNLLDHIYSIELSEELCVQAQKRFKNYKNIEIIHGDSGEELKNVIARINQSALFWLDGHYSGGVTAKGEKDTPIYEELHYILGDTDRRHVIIIDDARLFGANPAYPPIDELKKIILAKKDNVEIAVQDDIIRITYADEQLTN